MERLVRRETLEATHIDYWLQPAAEVSGDLPLVCTARNGDIYDARRRHGAWPAGLTLIPLSQTFYAMATKGYQLDSIARENEPAASQIQSIRSLCSGADGGLQFA